MIRVAPIKLQVGTKVLWFDPEDNDIHAGDRVVVTTERGTEFGTATAEITEVSEEVIETLKSPLKPVLRVATEEDIQKAEELAVKGEDALSVFKEMAAQTSDQMRPVMVEFLFDGDKAVFYFEAEERVDFRDLVRKLASRFHVRVDMRQIGVRDGARIVGGLGHCGQELCCKRLGGEFSPVSIRMAKEQNLSLNPQKISGCCGRLMCCLRYEYEAYKEVNSRAPKHGAKIEIPDGVARVSEVNVPLERVTLQLEDGNYVKIPLEEMEIVGDGKRPNRVSEEVFQKYSAPDPFEVLESTTFEVTSFTGNDKLADPNARPRGGKAQAAEEKEEGSHRKPRRRRRGGSGNTEGNGNSGNANDNASKENKSAGSQSKKDEGKKSGSSSRRPRRRGGSSKQGSSKQGSQEQRQQNSEARNSEHNEQQRSRKRPGQKSSGIRNAPRKEGNGSQQNRTKGGQSGNGSNGAGGNRAQASGEVAHRKPRRRRQKSGGETSDAK